MGVKDVESARTSVEYHRNRSSVVNISIGTIRGVELFPHNAGMVGRLKNLLINLLTHGRIIVLLRYYPEK